MQVYYTARCRHLLSADGAGSPGQGGCASIDEGEAGGFGDAITPWRGVRAEEDEVFDLGLPSAHRYFTSAGIMAEGRPLLGDSRNGHPCDGERARAGLCVCQEEPQRCVPCYHCSCRERNN